MTLTQENYYGLEANREYMSVSQYKDFTRCPAMAMAKLRGEWMEPKSSALLVGSFVDSYFEGTLRQFKAANPEIYNSRTGELKADYRQALEIIARIKSDPLMTHYLSGLKQIIRTGEFAGAKWKIKIDSLLPDRIVDLKVMRDMDRIYGKSFVEYWGYDLQMAIYHIVEGNGLETYLAASTKEDPVNIEVIHIPGWRRDECLDEVEKRMPNILLVKGGKEAAIRCGTCAYCRSTKVLTEPVDFELVGYTTQELALMKGVTL